MAAPSFGRPVITDVRANSVRVSFTVNTGGKALTGLWLNWSTEFPKPQSFVAVASGAERLVSGLAAGVKYAFWADGSNADGYTRGLESYVTTYKLYSVPRTPGIPTISLLTQKSFRATFAGGQVAGERPPVLEWELSWDTNPSPSSPANSMVYTGSYKDVLDLPDHGKAHYVWSRGRNVVGWSAYSSRATAQLIAGSWVKVNGIWQRAVPYVNDNGTWKLTRPWVKSAGVWKESQ